MRQKEKDLSLRRLFTFTRMKAMLVLALLCVMGVTPAMADTKNAGSYFKITHNPTVSEPWIEWEYIDYDEYGYDDVLTSCSFYIGWDGGEKQIFSFGRSSGGMSRQNTGYGAGKITYSATSNDLHYKRIRFWPSSALGSGNGSLMCKNFYIRMIGHWDIDDDGGKEDYNINEVRKPNMDSYKAISTPTLNFSRSSKTKLSVTGKMSNEAGWSGGICFANTNETQTSDIWHKNNLGNINPDGSGNINGSVALPEDERTRIKYYYHRYQLRTENVDGISVRQLLDGELKSYEHDGFQDPRRLTAEYDRYEQKTTLTWTNSTEGKNTDGHNVIFRKTDNSTNWDKIATLENDIEKYEDNTAYVGYKYEYLVQFIPNSYGNITNPDKTSALGSPQKTATSDPCVYVESTKKFNIELQTETNESGSGSIVLRWKPETSKYNLDYTVSRWDEQSSSWRDLYTGKNTTYADNDNLRSYTTYRYRVTTNFWNTPWSVESSICYQMMTKVEDVKATQGMYNNMVKVSWKANQKGSGETRFIVSRKPLNDPTATYTDVYEVNGTSSSYYFDDISALPGMYYMYRVTPYAKIPDTERESNPSLGDWGIGSSIETDGFCQAKGIISGRVTFGTGTAVEGVKVRLEKVADQDSGNDDKQQYYSVSTNGEKGALTWTPSENTVNNSLQGKPYTIQMWAKAKDDSSTESGRKSILSVPGQMSLYLVKDDSDAEHYGIAAALPGATEPQATTLKVPANSFSNISLANDGNGNYVIRIVNEASDNGITVDSVAIAASNIDWNADDITLQIGGNGNAGEKFDGYVDDVRVWSRALSSKDVKNNYLRVLSGSEQGLLCYWPMDEGIDGLPYAYDSSKKNGTPNGNHAKIVTDARPTSIVPTTDQLALYGETNSEGSYEIRGIPFTGDGTSYVVRPEMGIHEFNAKYVTRFVNSNSLTHNGVDFEDVSSFPVRGVVYYENTTIPVNEAYLYIDGNLASREGEALKTNENGEFNVDVPIGDHSIIVKKDGHTFVSGGRYPADPDGVGTTATFEKEITGLTFYDNTLVTVAGRVAGGDVENDKPLGLKLSKANIGQAKVVLDFNGSDRYLINAVKNVDGLVVSYDQNSEARSFERSTDNVKSTAQVEGGKNKITILTDPQTGEFAAQLPPLVYYASNITIPAQPDAFDFSSKLPTLDASNPQIVRKDSVENAETGEVEYFEYVAAARVEHKAASTIDVTENEDGTFGRKTVAAKDVSGNESEAPIYEIDEDGNVNYIYGYPVYKQDEKYTYRLHAYEKYVNKDDAQNIVEDLVPLAGAEVKIQNEYAAGAEVKSDGTFVSVEENTFELDDDGKAQYRFRAGLPNINEPYTRGIAITYDNNGTVMQWDGNNTFKAIVLGVLPTGNNFVTKGPDKVAMILRDPPGTNSSTTYSAGSSITKAKTTTVRAGESVGYDMTTKFGFKAGTWTGVGAGTWTEAESTFDFDFGISETYEYENDTTYTSTVTTTEDVSTSDGADFVGAVGDVFIGASTNITLGTSQDVVIYKNTDGDYEMGVKQNMIASQEYDTKFNYTANYIENVLIPNLEDARNNLLRTVPDVEEVACARPGTGYPIYVTEYDENDEHFGLSNDDEAFGDRAIKWTKAAAEELKTKGYWHGPSYSIILPLGYNRTFSDEIEWYNSSIVNWERQLYNNEKAKVDAIEQSSKYFKKNVSFDAGAIVTETSETTVSHENTRSDGFDINVTFGEGWDAEAMGNGYEFHLEENVTSGGTWTGSESRDSTFVFSYTLAEDGDDDYLTVDVYDAPDGFGPIFRTKAGATCAPFEDEVVTKYYKPGFVLQARTLMIEKPELSIEEKVLIGVPAGKEGVIHITLANNSETGEDCYYGLWVNPESNPDGLQVLLDGKNIAEGVTLLIPAGEPVRKTLTVRQSDVDVLSYENVSLSMYSTSQPDDTGIFPGIYSDKSFSVYFQPSCSDIDLAASTSVYNNRTDAPLTLSMSGYDYNQASFQSIRLQYKGENDANFVTLQEYVKDPARAEADPNLKVFSALTGTQKLTYALDLSKSDFTDQTYIFRAVTVGLRGGDEVTNTSEEIRVVRDVNSPQLITMPSPVSGVLTANDNITITFNEDVRDNLLTKVGNFIVSGVMNESEVAHDVALALSGDAVAKTESTINLVQKPFSVNLWMKYTQDGRILQHGTTGNTFTAAVEDGKLALSIGDKKVVSTESMPKDKWLYLAISYDNSGTVPMVNAGYGQDAGTVSLINNEEVVAYEGNGPVALGGEGLEAAIQELSIWNTARSLSDALGDMYLTKNQYTDGLVGYWQLNEGHGTVAEDRSHSRDLTISGDNAWYLNSGTNYELTLDGQKNIKAEANVASLANESYLVEAWFKATEGENGIGSILSMKDRFDIRLNNNGALELGVRGTYTTTYSAKNLYDGQWHHVALNVLKNNNGSAILYLDGKATRQFSASTMPLLSGGFALGSLVTEDGEGEHWSQHLKGAIDEVRVWKGSRTAEVINRAMYAHAKSDEAGLVAYYPMEKRGIDQFSQVVTAIDLTDQAGQGNAIRYDNNGANVATPVSQLSLANAPAQENVQFNFVASERQITISLDEQPYKLENCNINFTVRNVQDKNGNIADPITWSVFVQQNNLKWGEKDTEIAMTYGEGTTFTTEFENIAAQAESWSITGMPEWLSVNLESGTLAPLATQKLKFTVDPSIAVGNYDANIYLSGSQNINEPLNLTLTVRGQLPDWNPVPDAETMAIVGQLKMDGVISSDPEDMIAAFRGQECVGVAKPTYSSRYDSYMITMNVYGNEDTEGAALTYKVYDASTGVIYPSVSSSKNDAYSFTASKLVGSFTDPVIFTPENRIEEELSLNRKGWKWFSMYVTPDDNTIAGIFSDLDGEIKLVKNQDKTTSYDNGQWTGQIDALNPATMYKMQAASEFVESTIGVPVDPATVEIALKEGWNWIGYPAQAGNMLGSALADADPQEGDIVMSQSLFAIYSDGEWTGSLSGMTPGEGYKYFSNSSSSKTFHFQKPKAAGRKAPAKRSASLKLDSEFNMPMVATVVKDGQVVENAEVSIYTDGELCGYSAQSDELNRHFITIGGSKKVGISAVISIDGEHYTIYDVTAFELGKLCGSLQNPFVLDLDQATAIKGLIAGKAIRRIDIYDANGAMIQSIQQPASISLSESMSKSPSVYLQHVIYEDGTTATLKLTK